MDRVELQKERVRSDWDMRLQATMFVLFSIDSRQ
jgi:hypothetical protein